MRNYCPSPSLGIPAIAMCPALQEGREAVLRSTLTAPRRWDAFLNSRLAFAIWCARLQGHLWQGNCVLSFSYLVAASQGSCLDVSVQTRKVCRSPAGVRAGVMHCLPACVQVWDSGGVQKVCQCLGRAAFLSLCIGGPQVLFQVLLLPFFFRGSCLDCDSF